jgi:hypothetical protein
MHGRKSEFFGVETMWRFREVMGTNAPPRCINCTKIGISMETMRSEEIYTEE